MNFPSAGQVSIPKSPRGRLHGQRGVASGTIILALAALSMVFGLAIIADFATQGQAGMKSLLHEKLSDDALGYGAALSLTMRSPYSCTLNFQTLLPSHYFQIANSDFKPRTVDATGSLTSESVFDHLATWNPRLQVHDSKLLYKASRSVSTIEFTWRVNLVPNPTIQTNNILPYFRTKIELPVLVEVNSSGHFQSCAISKNIDNGTVLEDWLCQLFQGAGSTLEMRGYQCT